MKTETRAKTTEYKVYIAEDGAEFSNEEACRNREEMIRQKRAGITVSKIPCFHAYPSDIDMCTKVTFYRVTSHDELEAIKVHSFTDKDAAGWDFDTSEFPCWIRVLESGEGDGYIVTLDEEIQSVLRYVGKLRSRKEEIEKATGHSENKLKETLPTSVVYARSDFRKQRESAQVLVPVCDGECFTMQFSKEAAYGEVNYGDKTFRAYITEMSVDIVGKRVTRKFTVIEA